MLFISPLFPLQVHPCTALNAIDTMQPNQRQRCFCLLTVSSFLFSNHKRSPTWMQIRHRSPLRCCLLPSSLPLSQLLTMTLHPGSLPLFRASSRLSWKKGQMPVHNASCVVAHAEDGQKSGVVELTALQPYATPSVKR